MVNIYSREDFASLPFLAQYLGHNEDCNIKIVDCISKPKNKVCWIVDHAFLDPTYQKQLKTHIRLLEARVGIA